jgi:hypothetical protein
MKKQEIPSKIAKIIAAETEMHFMRVARLLRHLQETNPDRFVMEANQGGLNRRHAYALARIAQQFDGMNVSDDRLQKIGWAKLAIVGRHLTEKNVEQLLKLAEQLTSHELEGHFRGEKPKKGARATLLRLLPKDDDRFRKLLMTYGAVSSGNGLIGKESALVALLDHLESLIKTHSHSTAE